MSIDYPEVTEQDAPHVVDRKERLAKFVLELWAQRAQRCSNPPQDRQEVGGRHAAPQLNIDQTGRFTLKHGQRLFDRVGLLSQKLHPFTLVRIFWTQSAFTQWISPESTSAI